MRDEFTNHGVSDARESRRPGAGRRQIREKLFEVPAVVRIVCGEEFFTD